MITASLPDLEQLDLEAAKALLVAQHKIYVAALSSRGGEIERLRLLVEKLQRMLFGTKSEKVLRQIEQLELQLKELQASDAAEEHRAVAPAGKPARLQPGLHARQCLYKCASMMLKRLIAGRRT